MRSSGADGGLAAEWDSQLHVSLRARCDGSPGATWFIDRVVALSNKYLREHEGWWDGKDNDDDEGEHEGCDKEDDDDDDDVKEEDEEEDNWENDHDIDDDNDNRDGNNDDVGVNYGSTNGNKIKW